MIDYKTKNLLKALLKQKYISKGEYHKAYKTLEKCKEKDKEFYYTNKAKFLITQKRYKEAKRILLQIEQEENNYSIKLRSDKQKEIYGIVLKAQLAALEALKAGVTGKSVDKVARDIITEAGYGDCFGHGLGHSVGLFIHENPRLSPSDDTVLQAGMVETVEPGIYVPGFGGVRIEDMVVVTEDGYENLARSPKELIEVPVE